MLLRTTVVVFLGSVVLLAAQPGPALPWHLDGKGWDLESSARQAAQRAALAKPPLHNDFPSWTLETRPKLSSNKSEPAVCAIPLLTAPTPQKNFATHDYQLPPSSGDRLFLHRAMPVCRP